MWMNLQPLGDRLIVEILDEEETTVSGIVLPDTAKEKPQRGKVLAVGPGARDEDGEYIKMDLEEGFENQGAQLGREVATSTNDVAGDGTTTATVLAQAIVRDGLRNVAAGANPMAIKRGIEKSVEAVVENLKAQSKEISGKEDNARVATDSSRDREIGDVLSDAVEKVGKDGVVNVEEGQTFGLELEFTEGMQFDKGYLSPYMITDAERMEAVLDEPYILVANQKIGAVKDLLPVLEQVIQAGKPLLIV